MLSSFLMNRLLDDSQLNRFSEILALRYRAQSSKKWLRLLALPRRDFLPLIFLPKRDSKFNFSLPIKKILDDFLAEKNFKVLSYQQDQAPLFLPRTNISKESIIKGANYPKRGTEFKLGTDFALARPSCVKQSNQRRLRQTS